MPQFNVASLLRDDGDNRVIFAWRTGSNMITVRIDIRKTRGVAKHYSIEEARKTWKWYLKRPECLSKSYDQHRFEKETEPLDWDLIHDLLPPH